MRKTQKGIGFLGLVFLLVSIGVLGTIFMKMYPIYLNEMKIKRAVVSITKNAESTANAPALRSALQRYWDVDDVQFLLPADVTINKNGKKQSLNYDYYARADLFADISVIVHFKENIPITGALGDAN